MMPNKINQWMPSSLCFDRHNITRGGWGFSKCHWVDKNIDAATENATTPLGVWAEPQDFENHEAWSNNPNNWHYWFRCRYDVNYEGHNFLWDIHRQTHNPSVIRTDAHFFPSASLFVGTQINHAWTIWTSINSLDSLGQQATGHKYVEPANSHPKVLTVPKSTNLQLNRSWW